MEPAAAQKRKSAGSKAASESNLDGLIDKATIDCYNEAEKATGLFTMIEDNLALSFATSVLGIAVTVIAVDLNEDGTTVAVCASGGQQQRIALADLPLPTPPPSGVEEAYRRWSRARAGAD